MNPTRIKKAFVPSSDAGQPPSSAAIEESHSTLEELVNCAQAVAVVAYRDAQRSGELSKSSREELRMRADIAHALLLLSELLASPEKSKTRVRKAARVASRTIEVFNKEGAFGDGYRADTAARSGVLKATRDALCEHAAEPRDEWRPRARAFTAEDLWERGEELPPEYRIAGHIYLNGIQSSPFVIAFGAQSEDVISVLAESIRQSLNRAVEDGRLDVRTLCVDALFAAKIVNRPTQFFAASSFSTDADWIMWDGVLNSKLRKSNSPKIATAT